MSDLPRLRKITKGEYEIVGTPDIVRAETAVPFHYIGGWEVRRGARELAWGVTRREALERYMKLGALTEKNNESDLSNPIPIVTGSNAFDCPDCHVPMLFSKAIPTPEGAGVGIWHCTDCKVTWWEDGDEWYRARGRKQQ